MSFKITDKDQVIKIFNLRADTSEFIGVGDAYIPAHTGLPAYSTDIKPPAVPAGNVAVFDSEKKSWLLVEDHRGKSVFDTQTGGNIFIYDLGPLPKNTTTAAPGSVYDTWSGSEWVQDPALLKQGMFEQAEENRQHLLDEANAITADWRTELMLDVISDDDKASLTKWMAYIKKLKGLDFNGVATEKDLEAIKWPDKP